MIKYTISQLSEVHREILIAVLEGLGNDFQHFTSDRFYPGDGKDRIKRHEFQTLAEAGYFVRLVSIDAYKFTRPGVNAARKLLIQERDKREMRDMAARSQSPILIAAVLIPQMTFDEIIELAFISERIRQTGGGSVWLEGYHIRSVIIEELVRQDYLDYNQDNKAVKPGRRFYESDEPPVPNHDRVISRSYVADAVAEGDLDSVWNIIEGLQEKYNTLEARLASDWNGDQERLNLKSYLESMDANWKWSDDNSTVANVHSFLMRNGIPVTMPKLGQKEQN